MTLPSGETDGTISPYLDTEDNSNEMAEMQLWEKEDRIGATMEARWVRSALLGPRLTVQPNHTDSASSNPVSRGCEPGGLCDPRGSA